MKVVFFSSFDVLLCLVLLFSLFLLIFLEERKPVSEKRESAPNEFVSEEGDDLVKLDTSSTGTLYDFKPTTKDPTTTQVFYTDKPFKLDGVIDTFGFICPYFEIQVQLIAPNTYLWIGFEEIGGAALKDSSNLSYDCFYHFRVGDVIGVGVHHKTKKMYITKNGEMEKENVCEVTDEKIKETRICIKIRGGACKFNVNFGDQLLQFSPFKLQEIKDVVK